MSWSTRAIVWTTLACVFVPVYITAVICSVVKIYRDRKRIKEKNQLIRQSKTLSNGIETKESIKRPNIEIIHDEERASKFRSYVAASGTNLDEEYKKQKVRSKNNNRGNNKNRMANGHTTNVTIEHCPPADGAPADSTNSQGRGQNMKFSCDPDGMPVDSTSLLVQKQNIVISSSPQRREDCLYDAFDSVEAGGSDCSDLAVTTPSDAGSSHANTDTEIVCDVDQSYDYYLDPNTDRFRYGKPEMNSRDHNPHPQQRPSYKKQQQQQLLGIKRHEARHGSNNDIGTSVSALRHKSKGRKDDSKSPEKDLLGRYHVRNRRTSSGVIQDEEEKRRKDQEFRMSVIRSKSDDNVARENIDSNLFIYGQGKENHAFERSTESTRM